MNITFVKDHQSVASGNEFYNAGDQATLNKGLTLVEMGVAREGWGPLDIKIEATADTGIAEVAKEIESLKDVDFSALTKSEIVEIAEERGIGHIGQTKAKLIEALTEAN